MRHLLIALVLFAPAPTTAPSECGYLTGSRVEADIASLGIPLACEAHPDGAPAYVSGWYDGTTIHVWPAGLDDRSTRKLTAHELGHAQHDHHPAWAQQWTAARGTDSGEDFAEGYALAIYDEPGVGYQFTAGWPTDDQLALIRSWLSAPTTTKPPAPEPTTTTLPDPVVTAGATSPPVVIHLPQRPPATPQRIATLLHALEEVP
jgi:hypothetical protein